MQIYSVDLLCVKLYLWLMETQTGVKEMALVNKIKMAREVMECLAGGAPFPINDMTKSMMKLGFGDVAPAIFALFTLTLDDGIAIMSAHI